MPEERRVATEVQIALQPQAGQDPAAALTAAAAKLARQSLEMLVQQAGQPLTGKIVPPPPNLPAGMAQIAVADMVLTLKLSTPLPVGTPVRIDVQQTANGQPAVVVQPAPVNVPQSTVPAPAMPNMPAPAPSIALPPAQTAAPVPQPQVALQTPVAQQAAMTQTAARAQTTAVVTAPQPRSPAPAPQTSETSTAATTAQASPTPAQPAPQAPVAARPAATPPMSQPPTTAQPQVAVQSGSTAQQVTTVPAPATPGPTPPPTSAVPVAAQPQSAVTTQMPAPAAAAVASQTTSTPPAPAATQTQAAPVAPAASAQPAATQPQALLQRLTQAFAQPATPAPAAPPASGTPAQMVMTATTQAAAQQQSAAPLLQSLAARMPQLPTPVAEAAARVLAARINLDRGAPSGETLKQAVVKSGVFLDAPAKLGSQPDIRQALGQLRGTLLAWLGDDITPVAAVARQPVPPPAKGATPRGQAPELPPPTQGDTKEAGKTLLSQTEGALARVKLMQLSTQPADAARTGAALTPAAEWNLELPMMLGHELAMAQMQIARDGKGKSEAKDRNWRLRFALKFSMVGEVGAQVAMVGKRTSVAIWADEDATAEALEAMLPELAPALTAKGLDVISLTVRRGPPKDEARPAGRLMDSVT